MFSTSVTGYETKPPRNMIWSIPMVKKNLSLEELEDHIKKGYVFSGIYKTKYPMTMKEKTMENFDYTSYIMFDLDEDIEAGLDVLLDSLNVIPTIAYTTFRHQKKEGDIQYGNRYRLLYLFDEPITSLQDVEYIYKFISKENNFPDLNDNCGNSGVQLCFGTHSQCELFNTYNIINKESILNSEGYKRIIEEFKNNSDRERAHQDPIKKKQQTLYPYCPPIEININNKEYLSDFTRLKNDELFEKYNSIYPDFDRNMILSADENEPVIHIPSDYLMIKRPFIREKGKDGKFKLRLKKWKDGEKRRLKLYYNGIIRRFIKPDLTYEHLLQCLARELYYHYDNKTDVIRRTDLMAIAKSVMQRNLDSEKYQQIRECYRKSNPKIIANREYCKAHNISPQSVVARYRVNIMDERRMEIFDPTLTEKENLELFKEYGLGKSIKTVRRFRKRHGIGNWNKRNKMKNDE